MIDEFVVDLCLDNKHLVKMKMTNVWMQIVRVWILEDGKRKMKLIELDLLKFAEY